MSDLSIELDPVKARKTAVTKNLMSDVERDSNIGLRKGSASTMVNEESQSLHTADEDVLATFGKKQQLKRRFKSLSAIAFTSGLMVTWLGVLGALQFGLLNGGPAGLIWGFLGAFAGAMLQALVMGEIASMIPLSGGAFNWVAILAPPSSRKFLSYVAGWTTVISYQIYVLAVTYASASIIRGLMILTQPSYTPQLWHSTLITYALGCFGLIVNTYLGRILPHIEVFLLAFFVVGYLGILISLTYLSPHRTASDVFGTFLSLGGWENSGITFLVGWIASTGSFIGADGADHIAEEIESASKVIPMSMWVATLLNGVMGFGILIAALFATPDFAAATSSATGWAFIDIFVAGLGSVQGASALTAVIIIVDILSISSLMATASRALWAFSREGGLPFSAFLSRLDPKTRIPYNAVIVTMGILVLLGLISVGSAEAFEAFYSGQLAAYYTVFLLPACVMLHKRLTTPESQIPWGPFRLGRWGVPITIVAIIYTVVALFFSFFPGTLPVNPQNMNYSVLIYGASIIFMLVFWFAHGKKVYTGPVWEFDGEYVRRN